MLENVTVSSVLPLPDFRAVDSDLNGVIVYRVINRDLSSVFFGLNDDNKIFVRNGLTQAPLDQYTVGFKMKMDKNVMGFV